MGRLDLVLNKLIAMEPEQLIHQINLASALLQVGDLEEAEKTLVALTAKDPHSVGQNRTMQTLPRSQPSQQGRGNDQRGCRYNTRRIGIYFAGSNLGCSGRQDRGSSCETECRTIQT